MRIESSVTSVSWIPSEAITGMAKVPFEAGFTHYDVPRPTSSRTSRRSGPHDILTTATPGVADRPTRALRTSR
jgi:hypothetical protein